MLCLQRLCVTFLVLLGQIFASDADALGCKTCEVDFGRLDYRLRATAVVNAIFPEADEISLPTGEPPVATVSRDGEVIGYLYATYETVGAPGYAGEPFDVVAGVTVRAKIAGVSLLRHNEPIVKGNAPLERGLRNYLRDLKSLDILQPIKKPGGKGGRFHRGEVDSISGATISATLMHGAVITAARRVARSRGLIGNIDGEKISLDLDSYEASDWQSLILEGSVRCRSMMESEPSNAPKEICAALITPSGIGRNLFGDKQHGSYVAEIKHGEQLLWVGSRGETPWRMLLERTALSQYMESPAIFLKQGDFTLPFSIADQFRPVSFSRYSRRFHPENSGRFADTGMLKIKSGTQFQPYLPWQLELDFVDVDENETELIKIDYQIPSKYVIGSDFDLEEAGLQPITYVLGGLVRASKLTDWQRTWVEQAFNIFVLVMLLVVVSAVLVFEHVIVTRRRLHRWVRFSILAVVLVWLGWIAGAQLSIVNVFAYAQAIAGRLEWSTLLFEPLIVILVVYTALSLVLLGRGVFCGWLCPFGAFQELLNQLARFARVPQWTPSFTLNEGLWAVKYLIVIGLIAVSVLWSMEVGLLGTEVEPFKTAITLKFERAGPYAVYAILLLVAGLFMERFFCRFLCPLGGLLAFLGRFRLFQWLKRRPECGAPCHICEVSCPVQAIEPSGKINMNECFQCLDCQVDYYDDRRCPPLVFLRKKNEPATIFFPKPLAAK